MSGIEREPGLWPDDDNRSAVVEQQRAEILNLLRTSTAHSVTIAYGADGDALHSALYTRDDEEPLTFLCYAAAKAILDVAALLNGGVEEALALVAYALEQGIGG